ncbi:hypothetical protein D1AOALGA4SA_5022 [Olavius algarvensis Delta 1 endosymbiont]|nr:hypothetical protein D1AOALGA4SA_5022 [Olavius algarvensis Delta 1 endosymbiont]
MLFEKFDFLDFGFVSNFGFRVSYFRFVRVGDFVFSVYFLKSHHVCARLMLKPD